jgi:glycosyltransferase involved in cell wall biosynthesis
VQGGGRLSSSHAAEARPLRAVLVISNLEYGGAQRQVVELVNGLDAQGITAHLVSLSPYVPLAPLLQNRDRLHVVTKRFKYDLSVVPRLAGLLHRLQADVVQGYLFDAEIAVFLAGPVARTPLVIGSERNTDYDFKRVQLAALRLTRNLVDLVIANSNAGASFNQRMLGQPASKYRVVHNGVNLERFSPGDGACARRELGIEAEESVVGVFASFKAQKNHPLLFAAAARVLAKKPRTRFLLVGEQLHGGLHGSDEYRRRMDVLVDELGLRPRCLFLGNQDDVERLYRACDLTVLPSIFEGTPNVLLESMACGVPVVATHVADNGLIAPDGRVGYLVPLGDEAILADRILALLDDEDRRRDMGRAARAWVEQEFSYTRLAERTANIFREGLAVRGRT